MAAQLHVAFTEFKKFCKDSGFKSSQQCFKPATTSCTTQTDWPLLKAKGHNCAIVSLFLMATAENATDAKCQDYHSRALVTCLWGFASTWCICKGAGPWLRRQECQRLERARCAALQSYNVLSASCAAQGKYRYCVVPKLHKLDELLRKAITTGRNPMNVWTMSDEDWIGRMVNLGQSCHARSLTTRAIARFLVHWFNEL